MRATFDAIATCVSAALNLYGVRRVVMVGRIAELPAPATDYLIGVIQRASMWSRFDAVAVTLAPKRVARGLVIAGIHRFVMPADWSSATRRAPLAARRRSLARRGSARLHFGGRGWSGELLGHIAVGGSGIPDAADERSRAAASAARRGVPLPLRACVAPRLRYDGSDRTRDPDPRSGQLRLEAGSVQGVAKRGGLRRPWAVGTPPRAVLSSGHGTRVEQTLRLQPLKGV